MAFGFLALFITFAVVVGGATLTGMLFYLFSRLRRLEGGGFEEPDSRQLSDPMNRMAEEILALQEEVANLTERLDFTEKLLMSGEDDDPNRNSG